MRIRLISFVGRNTELLIAAVVLVFVVVALITVVIPMDDHDNTGSAPTATGSIHKVVTHTSVATCAIPDDLCQPGAGPSLPMRPCIRVPEATTVANHSCRRTSAPQMQYNPDSTYLDRFETTDGSVCNWVVNINDYLCSTNK